MRRRNPGKNRRQAHAGSSPEQLFFLPSPPCLLLIALREGVPFEQEGLSFILRRRIGEAISKIQFGGMFAGFPEVAISLACDASLHFADRLNRDVG
jgi:hypothetical protein